MIVGRGTVVRFLRNGNVQVLYADANVAEFERRTGDWLVTNQAGKRFRRAGSKGLEKLSQDAAAAIAREGQVAVEETAGAGEGKRRVGVRCGDRETRGARVVRT